MLGSLLGSGPSLANIETNIHHSENPNPGFKSGPNQGKKKNRSRNCRQGMDVSSGPLQGCFLYRDPCFTYKNVPFIQAGEPFNSTMCCFLQPLCFNGHRSPKSCCHSHPNPKWPNPKPIQVSPALICQAEFHELTGHTTGHRRVWKNGDRSERREIWTWFLWHFQGQKISK